MKTPRSVVAALFIGAFPGLAMGCPQGTHMDMSKAGMPCVADNSASPTPVPARTNTVTSLSVNSTTPGDQTQPQPSEEDASAGGQNAPTGSAGSTAGGDSGGLEAQRQQLLNNEALDDEKNHINKFFDDIKGQTKGAALPAKDLEAFKDYLESEDHLKDVILKQLPPQAAPEVKNILENGDYTQAGQLDEKLHGVFDRWGANWGSFAPGVGLFHPWGGEWGVARKDTIKKMEAAMQGEMATSLMKTDAVATWLMNKSENDNHDNNWKENAGSDPFPFLYSGQKELQNGQTDEAISDLSKSISRDPSNEQALALRGEAYAMKGDYAAAGADAQNALRLNPGDEKMQRLYAMSQDKGGPGASGALNDLAGLGASKSGATAGNVGMSEASSGGPAARGGGASAAAYNDAKTAMRVGDYALAAGRLSRAIALNGDNAAAYNLRSIAYNRLGQFELALKDAIAGLKVAPNNVALLISKAMALNRLHRYAEAEAAAREALRLDPNNARAYDALAQALAGQHKNGDAIAALRKAATLDSRYQAKLDQALQLPAEADLSFLFPDDDSAAPKKAPAAQDKGRKFGGIVGISLLGGLILGLGLLKVFAPRLKDALTRLTRREPVAVSPAEGPALTPQADAARLLRGQYRFVREIGAGGMGVVYEGDDTTLRRKVAIKKMRDEVRLDRRERERFVSEAKVVAGLHHPGIVDIYAIVEDNEDIYLVFEYVSGKTLHELVHGEGTLPFVKAVAIVKEAGQAIDFAHSKNVIHRDLKPSNIMLDAEGRAKVMDFGIARLAKDAMANYSQTNTVVGTPPYMAPEQEQGIVRRESDVYALSICLYELLTGRMPFNGSGAGMLMNKINKTYAPPSTLAPSLPAGVDEVFAKAFEPDPDKRFHSAKEFVSAFETLLPAKV